MVKKSYCYLLLVEQLASVVLQQNKDRSLDALDSVINASDYCVIGNVQANL